MDQRQSHAMALQRQGLHSSKLSRSTAEYDGLPKNINPIHYSLTLFDLIFRDPWTFQGIVRIDLEVASETKSITVNAHELRVHSAEVDIIRDGQTGSKMSASRISHDVRNQRCTFSFDETLPRTSEANVAISIKFEGIMNDHLTGFYRSAYSSPRNTGSGSPEQHHFSTQFQPCDARRAFPCFDEPGMKATFDFEIEIPKHLTALSNMPETTNSGREGSNSGLKTVKFERTPRMSTYLLAWAVGEFEFIECIASRQSGHDLPMRVYTTHGRKQHAAFALKVAEKVVAYFSKMFQVEYPLPKLDMIAVHEMPDDAMENWGLLTFLPSGILFDAATSASSSQTYVAYLVAHELAHQWFGNLVTMQWWDELWLNEGFATWAGWDAVDHLYPDWTVWSEFVGDSMKSAFELDSIHASHPVQVEVPDGLEVDSIFDAISYKKGSSLIRMLANYLGKEKFVQGVANYLKAHAYGSTNGDDLWRALSEVSGQDVASFMDAWIKEKGFPLIIATESESGGLILRQQRFLRSRGPTEEEDQMTWWIPVLPRYGKAKTPQTKPLTAREGHYEIKAKDLLTLNAGHAGYYRVALPLKHLERLSHRLDELTDQESIGLIGDLAALAAAGQGDITMGTLLSYLRHFREEEDSDVWYAILTSVAYVQSLFSSDPEIAQALDKYILDLTAPGIARLGKDFFTNPKPTATSLHIETRNALLHAAGLAGHPGILSQAQTQTALFLSGNNDSALPPSLRETAFSITAKHQPTSTTTLLKAYQTTTSIDGREILLSALGHTPTPQNALDLLAYAFLKPRIETPHLVLLAEGLAANTNPLVRASVWTFIRANWPAISSRLAGSVVLLDRFLQTGLETLVDFDGTLGEEMREFWAGRDCTGFARGVGVAVEMAEGNGEVYRRTKEEVRGWLRGEGLMEEKSS